MLFPIKIADIELSRPTKTVEGLEGYKLLKGLVRLHGVPLGYVQAPITNSCCSAQILNKLILKQHSRKIIQQLLYNNLIASPKLEELQLEDLLEIAPPEYEGNYPLVTVVVCTRDRTADLALCLDALSRLDYPNLELLVVDNAPQNDATKQLVKNQYPNVRYTCEPRPGLDWARNRGILEATGEIIAYTDDDVIVDAQWVKSLAQIFAENPDVMAVTGLVVPHEQETEAQVLFELYGGFGRGFERKWYRRYPDQKMPWQWLGAGQFGTGANMAYRRSIFQEIGLFDPALDVGTVTNGGGDLEMFFRVLKEGHTLVYEPRAIVRHRHRQDYAKLRSQLENNSLGFFSYCVRSVLAYPDEWFSFLKLAVWWIFIWNIIRLWIGFKHPTRFPRDLVLAEFGGCFPGLTRYQKANKNVEKIRESFGEPEFSNHQSRKTPTNKSLISRRTAIRHMELNQPLEALQDVRDYSDVQIFVTWNQQLLGSITIANIYQSISPSRLIDAVVTQLRLKPLEAHFKVEQEVLWNNLSANLERRYAIEDSEREAFPLKLSPQESVSIVIATYDRPDDLRQCLNCITTQNSARDVEIIVVDNHLESGLTPPIVSEFPNVKLIAEKRKGLSYARNAGIVASRGDIIIATDDDVTMPPDWLEKLIAPLTSSDVMIVTGNVLPLELDTIAQRFFERYGGLGRGFKSFAVDWVWFESFPRKAVPTWQLGATANAAFRASIFHNPEIGLIEETLGVGTPTGCSEDTYLFYQVLKAGYTIFYEPNAYVWHKHRQDMSALRRQIYNYSKGHVAYHLTTWRNDGDWRGLFQILVALPYIHCQRIYYWLRGWSNYPLSLILLEVAGNLAGPLAWLRSRARVEKEGRSDPYVPFSERIVAEKPTELDLSSLAMLNNFHQS